MERTLVCLFLAGWLAATAAVAAPPRPQLHLRPIFVEAFGSSTHADLDSRVRWTEFNRHEAEVRGPSWGFWCFTPPFGIHDVKMESWEPALLEALIP